MAAAAREAVYLSDEMREGGVHEESKVKVGLESEFSESQKRIAFLVAK